MNVTFKRGLNRNVLFQLSKRFKKKQPKPPRDPPPARSFMKHNLDPSFEPFVSAEDFETDPNRGGKWTKIDHRQSSQPTFLSDGYNELATTPSPDSILSEYSQPQILPRTRGIKHIAKVIQEQGFEHRLPPQPKIEVVAEDDNYIFVHKPAGIACHGSEEYEYSTNMDIMDIQNRKKRKRRNPKEKTFYELFMEYWWTTYPFWRFQPRLLHRLDKDVSGLMVFGKKWCAEEHFNNLIHGNSDYFYGCGVKKCYIAVCKGIPSKSEGMIEGMIKKAHWNYKRFAIYPHKGNKYVSDAAKVDTFEIEDHQHVDNTIDGKKGGQHVKTVMCFLFLHDPSLSIGK